MNPNLTPKQRQKLQTLHKKAKRIALGLTIRYLLMMFFMMCSIFFINVSLVNDSDFLMIGMFVSLLMPSLNLHFSTSHEDAKLTLEYKKIMAEKDDENI